MLENLKIFKVVGARNLVGLELATDINIFDYSLVLLLDMLSLY